MEDSRTMTVVGLLQQQRDLAIKLVEILGPEIMSYEIIRGDHERKRKEMKDLEDQKTIAKMEIEKAKESAGRIIQEGEEEKKKLVEITKNNILTKMSEASKLLENVKQFVQEMDKKRLS